MILNIKKKEVEFMKTRTIPKATTFLCATTLVLTLSSPVYATESDTQPTAETPDVPADTSETTENPTEKNIPETTENPDDASQTEPSDDENAAEDTTDIVVPEEEETNDSANDEAASKSAADKAYAAGIAIDAANFPDPAFRLYVSNHFDSNDDGILSNQERDAVTDMQIVDDQTLVSLEGIRFFPNLQTLTCYSRALESVDVSENTKLRSLTIHLNISLTSLILGNLPDLKTLDCMGTNLTSLDLSGVPALETLDCTSTPLTALDVSANSNLRVLRCANSYISQLDVSHLSELVELQAYIMPITELDVSHNPKLEMLWVQMTKLTTLDTSNNPELKDVFVFDTQVHELDFSHNPKLTSLGAAMYGSDQSNYFYVNLPSSGQTGYAELPAQNTLYVDTDSKKFDVTKRFPNIKVDRISNLKGAKLDGTILSGYSNETPVSYTYDCGQGHKIDVTVQINTVQKQPTLTIEKKLNKTYDGNPVSLTKDDLNTDGSDGALTIEWYQQEKDDLVKLDSAPVDAGLYVVKVKMAETDSMLAAQTSQQFTITKQTNYWVQEPSVPQHTYDGKAPVPVAQPKYGDVTITYSTSQNGPWQSEPFVNAGQYFMRAQVAGSKNTAALDTIVPYRIDRQVVSEVATPEVYGKTGQSLAQIALPTGWSWYDPSQYLHAQNEKFIAILAVDTQNYDYSGVEGFAEDEHVIVRQITIHRSILPNRWVQEPTIEDWTYGQEASTPKALATLGSYALQFTYYARNDLTTPIEKPTEAGLYTLVGQIPGTANYTGLSKQVDFEIRKAANSWKTEPAIKDWTYGQKPSVPSGEAAEGTVEFSYASDENGPFTADMPTQAGSYFMKAYVPASKNFEALEKIVPFSIQKQVVDSLDTPTVYAVSTMQLKDIPLPTGWAWENPEEYVYDANRHHKAYYVVDSANTDYSGVSGFDPQTNTVQRTIAISLNAAANEWESPLTIADWTYGQKASSPTAKAKYGSDTIEYHYFKDSSLSEPIEKPTNAGTYVVQAIIPGTKDYAGLQALATFTIKKADNSWKLSLMQNDYVYNGKPPKPNALPVSGTVEYTYATDPNGPFTSTPPVDAGDYIVKAYVPASDNYNELEATQPFTILRQIVDEVPSPVVYATSQTKLSDLVLENGWMWADPDGIVTSSTLEQTITKKVDSKNYDYSDIEGYDPNTDTITRTITIQMSRLENEWVHPLELKNWTYGQTPSIPTAIAKHGMVRYLYTDASGNPLASKPIDAGNYVVYAYVVGTADYAGLHASQAFTIEKADNNWEVEPAIENTVYNGQPPIVQGQAEVGTVQFTYATSKNGPFVSQAPVDAGTYYMKASVEEQPNYNALESEPIPFEITPKPADPIETPTVFAMSGSILKNVPLPEGWSWVDDSAIVHSQNDTHEIVMKADDPNYDYSNVEG
ncbi:hypothetical protein C815_00560, partial [Firmicutes bacterium M10-2]